MDDTQIKALARRFDPHPFPDKDSAKATLLAGLVAGGLPHRRDLHAAASRQWIAARGGHHRCWRRIRLGEADTARRHAAGRKRSEGNCALAVAAGSGDEREERTRFQDPAPELDAAFLPRAHEQRFCFTVDEAPLLDRASLLHRRESVARESFPGTGGSPSSCPCS